MGRKDVRQSAKFSFYKREIEFYRPTEGQGAAFAMISAAKTNDEMFKGAIRFFTIIEKLTVDSADWDWMDAKLVDGSATVSSFSDLIKEIFQYEWDADGDE